LQCSFSILIGGEEEDEEKGVNSLYLSLFLIIYEGRNKVS
jgi:hypothetical protein